uniref:OBP47-like domain-containing protein n=1 Tax=Megaselia scalaris TaxID=36166 RepID=T1H0V8_MEGSC
MIASFEKCGPAAAQRIEEWKKISAVNPSLMKRKCSPYAGLVLGCTYMEYFKICPESKWTSSKECNKAREFVKQCTHF